MVFIESNVEPHVFLGAIVAILEKEANVRVQHVVALCDGEEVARFIPYPREGEEEK